MNTISAQTRRAFLSRASHGLGGVALAKGQQLAQLQGQKRVCKGPMFRFQKYGRCQLELSELLPLGQIIPGKKAKVAPHLTDVVMAMLQETSRLSEHPCG